MDPDGKPVETDGYSLEKYSYMSKEARLTQNDVQIKEEYFKNRAHMNHHRTVSKQEIDDFVYQMNLVYFDDMNYEGPSEESKSFTINQRSEVTSKVEPD